MATRFSQFSKQEINFAWNITLVSLHLFSSWPHPRQGSSLHLVSTATSMGCKTNSETLYNCIHVASKHCNKIWSVCKTKIQMPDPANILCCALFPITEDVSTVTFELYITRKFNNIEMRFKPEIKFRFSSLAWVHDSFENKSSDPLRCCGHILFSCGPLFHHSSSPRDFASVLFSWSSLSSLFFCHWKWCAQSWDIHRLPARGKKVCEGEQRIKGFVRTEMHDTNAETWKSPKAAKNVVTASSLMQKWGMRHFVLQGAWRNSTTDVQDASHCLVLQSCGFVMDRDSRGMQEGPKGLSPLKIVKIVRFIFDQFLNSHCEEHSNL